MQQPILRSLLSLIPRRVVIVSVGVKLHLIKILKRDLLSATEGPAVVLRSLRRPLLHLIHHLLLISLESGSKM